VIGNWCPKTSSVHLEHPIATGQEAPYQQLLAGTRLRKVLELKDAFFSLLLAPKSQQFFSFKWNNPEIGISGQLTCTRLPPKVQELSIIFDEDLYEDLNDPVLRVILFIIILCIYLVTVCGNLSTILLIRVSSQLHHPMYFFLSHLASSDIGYSSSVTPNMLVNFLVKRSTISYLGCAIQLGSVELSCSDDSIFIILATISVGTVIVFTVLVIVVSYTYILITILKMQSTEGRHKAFSTCTSHLTAVTLFYGTVTFIYVMPKSSYSTDQNKVLSVFYMVVIPMLNPLIYSLRNNEIKGALKRQLVTIQQRSSLANSPSSLANSPMARSLANSPMARSLANSPMARSLANSPMALWKKVELSCSDDSVFTVLDSFSAGSIIVITVFVIAISYTYILITILKMHSTEGRHKAFSTCTSHLTAVIVFYGTVTFIYVMPKSSYSTDQNKVLSVFYMVVIPMLNPLIYSLRNNEIKGALKRHLVCRKVCTFETNIGLLLIITSASTSRRPPLL
ncbi:hypothetical protein STEG23_005560, partial [Scotinomys teguina]